MDKLVSAPCGVFLGAESGVRGVSAFRGIRYAEAVRFGYPEEITAYEGLVDATAFRDSALQYRTFHDESALPEKQFYYREFRKGLDFTYSEDCLHLNIFAPEGAKHLPVLFYIHGGSFLTGSPADRPFRLPELASRGLVVVTVGYRLGYFGFGCFEEQKKTEGHTGNYGLFDQYTALLWVRHNIAAFGGDPDNITLMGQSAGAISVDAMLRSPLCAGEFRRAVLSSGMGLLPLMRGGDRRGRRFWKAVKAELGVTTLEELRSADSRDLYAACEAAGQKRKFLATPCRDGVFFGPVKRKETLSLMAGANSEDMGGKLLFRLVRGALRRRRRDDRYLYYFRRQLPGDERGAWHSADLWYWFGCLSQSWRPMERTDYDLSFEMMERLAAFCRTGDPNTGRFGGWENRGKEITFG